MSLTFNLDALFTRSDVGAGLASEQLLPPAQWARPWQAFPLALYRLINWGERDRQSDVARVVYTADLVVRGLSYTFGPNFALYLAIVSRLGRERVEADDWYVWVALGVAWCTQALLLGVSLWGRFEGALPTLGENERRERPELRIPAVLYNFQSFGTEGVAGAATALAVAAIQLYYAAGWGVLLYEGATRALVNDAYKALWCFLLGFWVVQHCMTALARAVSFGELRSAAAKPDSEPTAIESTRVTLVCLYVFTALLIATPMCGFLIQYVYV